MSNENQEAYEASIEEERDFQNKLREHIEQNFLCGELLSMPTADRMYLMQVTSISRLQVLELGQFHISIEDISAGLTSHTIQLTLKRL